MFSFLSNWSFWFYFTMILFLFFCAILILVVLIQKGRGGGLSSAFGGSGGNTAFGAKTGDVLTWATSILFGLFLVFAVVLNKIAEQVGTPPPPTVSQVVLPSGSAPLNVPAGPGSTNVPVNVPTTNPAP